MAKLKDTLTNDTLSDRAGWPRRSDSRSRCCRSDRAEDARRRRQDQHRDAPAGGRGPDHPLRARPADQGAAALGPGQLHIEVTVAKLKRRFGVEVNLKPPRIPYRETITMPVEAHGRHKKQTGGHGQFGDCKIRMEPMSRGSDFEFADDIFGGSIPRQFVPAVGRASRTRGCAAFSRVPGRRFKVTVFEARPRRGQQRDVVQDGRRAGLQGRDEPRPADDSRAGDVGRDPTRQATTPAT